MHSCHYLMPLLFLSRGQKSPVLLIYFLENHIACYILCYAYSEILLISPILFFLKLCSELEELILNDSLKYLSRNQK